MGLRTLFSKVKNLAGWPRQIIRSKKTVTVANYFLLAVLISSVGTNQVVNGAINEAMGVKKSFFKLALAQLVGEGSLNNSNSVGLAGDAAQDAIKLVISKGVPDVYGPELNVTFDQVQQSMNVMAKFDPTYGKNKITLTSDGLKRYIDIGLKIACEYCCGAKSIVFQNGEAACGCAHSQAMRGLAAYLIQNHGSEYSNDQILRELARWKGVYFPKQTIKKMAEHLQNGNFTPDTAALIMDLKLPDYGKGNQEAPLPSDIENLPGMVGGC